MKTFALILTAVLLLGAPPALPAQIRYVVVNGQRMGPADLQRLDRASCTRVPNGRYWLNMRSGVWGYEGGPPQGRMGEHCQQQRRRSLSERGLLYSPGELLR